MKSGKKMHKKGHMGDCFGVGPPVCDKKKQHFGWKPSHDPGMLNVQCLNLSELDSFFSNC